MMPPALLSARMITAGRGLSALSALSVEIGDVAPEALPPAKDPVASSKVPAVTLRCCSVSTTGKFHHVAGLNEPLPTIFRQVSGMKPMYGTKNRPAKTSKSQNTALHP